MSFTSHYHTHSVGVDYIDHELRYVQLVRRSGELIPTLWGTVKCSSTLDVYACRTLARLLPTKNIALGIPAATTVVLPIPLGLPLTRASVLSLLAEQEITPDRYIIEYTPFKNTDRVLVVHALAKAVAHEYVSTAKRAGLRPTALVLRSSAQARALTDHTATQLIVSYEKESTTISIASYGLSLFSTVLPIGASQLLHLVQKASAMNEEEANKFLFEKGMHDSAFYVPLGDALTPLVEEIRRIYIYWHDKKRAQGTEVESIICTGMFGGIKGLTDFLSSQLRTSVTSANPWRHCLSFEHTIPALLEHEAQAYSSAIGLSLGTYRELNLLPEGQLQLLRDRRRVHRVLALIGTTVLAGALGFAVSLFFGHF